MANITTQTIRVDLSTGKVIPTAYTHQNDTARTLVFDMYNGGLPYTMTGNTVKFAYKSPIVNGQYTVIVGSSMASGTVSGNTVSVTLPAAYTAISGVGLLTMIITPTSGTIRPVNIKFIVQKSADGDDTIAGASDFPASLDEIAENWLDENISIQIDDTLSVSGKAADAKVTGDEISELDEQIGDLKSDLTQLSETVDGVITYNYTEGKNFTVSSSAYSIIDDENKSISDFIPITWSWGTSVYTRFYYTDSDSDSSAASYKLLFFDANKDYIDYYSGSAGGRYRAIKGMSNAAFVRFSFKKGFAGKLTNSANPPTVTHWTTGSSITENGLVQDVGNVENLNTTDKASLVSAVNEVNDKVGGCLDDSYLDYSMINRLNPDDCQTGTRVNVTTGVVSTYESYYTTDFIDIRAGETLYFYRFDTLGRVSIPFFAAYDKNKTVIPSLGSEDGVQSITQSGEMAFVRCSFLYIEGDLVRDPHRIGCMSNSDPDYVTGYGNNPVFKSKYTREIVNVYKSDTEAQVINKFIHAFFTGDCDVIFERGDYSFGAELTKVKSDYGLLHNEIPIGNGCRYFFNGSFLTAVLDLSQLTPESGDDEFYCNFFGCQRRPSSYELHDGVLSATDTRYVVHDESSGQEGSYKHLYQNMEMNYHTNARQESIRKCLGGGTGADGVVEIVGCKFTTDGTANCVSFHGNGTDVEGAKFDINMRNNWFSNAPRVNQMSTHQTARIFYVGNSASEEITIGDNCTLTAFMNEIRT